jgi:hypothetical protein
MNILDLYLHVIHNYVICLVIFLYFSLCVLFDVMFLISKHLKSIQKTSGLSKSKLQLLGWLNH